MEEVEQATQRLEIEMKNKKMLHFATILVI